jgi:hypothetical protein
MYVCGGEVAAAAMAASGRPSTRDRRSLDIFSLKQTDFAPLQLAS